MAASVACRRGLAAGGGQQVGPAVCRLDVDDGDAAGGEQ